jgi:hypothetical protein
LAGFDERRKLAIMAKRTGKAAQQRARVAAAKAAVARAQRRQRWTVTGIGLAVVVVLAVVVGVVIWTNRPTTKSEADSVPDHPRTTAVGRTSNPPWAAPADASSAVKAAGLPMLGSEGSVEHIHAHLDVLVNGKPVSVPEGLGIDNPAQQISPLHTHDTTGVIHVESPKKVPFSLGQFFTEWQVSLAADHIGGLKAGGDKQLRVYINGKPYQGNPAAIILKAHDEIAVVYGTAAQQKNPPSSYRFASGE